MDDGAGTGNQSIEVHRCHVCTSVGATPGSSETDVNPLAAHERALCPDSALGSLYRDRMHQISWPGEGFAQLVVRAARLMESSGPQRHILGIAGAPASGKSTLAEQLREQLIADHPGRVALVGMDAFHLAQRVLDEHGLAGIKGAPQTFDAAGYGNLLRRLRGERAPVYAPKFDRGIEDSIAQAIEIGPAVDLIITEGNYLLLDDGPWTEVSHMLDESWLIDLDEAVRRERLVARHQWYGRDRRSAEERAYGNDQRNADLVMQRSCTPDVMIRHGVAPSMPGHRHVRD